MFLREGAHGPTGPQGKGAESGWDAARGSGWGLGRSLEGIPWAGGVAEGGGGVGYPSPLGRGRREGVGGGRRTKREGEEDEEAGCRGGPRDVGGGCREDLRGPTEGPRSPLPCERGGGPRGPTVACLRWARGPTGAHGGPRFASRAAAERREEGRERFRAKGKRGCRNSLQTYAKPQLAPKKKMRSRGKDGGEREKAKGGGEG